MLPFHGHVCATSRLNGSERPPKLMRHGEGWHGPAAVWTRVQQIFGQARNQLAHPGAFKGITSKPSKITKTIITKNNSNKNNNNISNQISAYRYDTL